MFYTVTERYPWGFNINNFVSLKGSLFAPQAFCVSISVCVLNIV